MLDLAFPDLGHELIVTRRVLRRVPDEHWEWRPHEKSRPLGALALHLVEILQLAATVLSCEAYDVAAGRWPRGAPETREQLLAAYDSAGHEFTQALAAVQNGAWARPFTVRSGGTTLLAMPRAAVFRSMVINHLVHHRAQLAGYMRQLGIPLLALYGPTADEDGPPM